MGALDFWTLIHFGAGFAVGLWLVKSDLKGLPWAILVVVGVFGLWEVMEAQVGPGGFGGAENGANLLVDLIAGWLGLAVWTVVGSRLE